MKDITLKKVLGIVIGAFLVLAVLSAIYTVNEGHVGIVKRFGKAVEQVGPGIHAKLPFIDGVEEMEVRTRKNVESLNAGTSEQMPFTADTSVTWTVNKDSAMELYVDFGSLEQFESRVLDPKLRSAAKDAFAKFTAEDIIRNRGQVIATIEQMLIEETKDLPIQLGDVQVEDIRLPQNYIASIEKKQTAKNLRDAEQFNLEKQALEAQRAVNTANADRDATKARADGDLYAAIKEAEGRATMVKALGGPENLIRLEEIKAWNGSRIVVGSAVPVTNVDKLLNLSK